ncbi:GNAT family N-acetyltransferase [Spirosoma sp. HMF4905]|uniref:GNAT family N-acetyltransferase n=1 Tax=Spirosoma arboris TaxID=2682092 RepID=A0A7K1S975_9BACT|nr:GNAT family N-acetyltransferase [Spirosoma arboris]MVM30367.1 GNAT family N-acetyltransferase [Spirosoma arboris]
MNIRYEMTTGLPSEPILTVLLDLLGTIFNNQDRTELLAKLTYQASRTGLQTQWASINDRIVGCKFGYERKPGQFYSWLGGVHPDFRGQGIAAELMRQQHDWCRQNKYNTIRTQTYNQWRSMLLLNLRFEFDIIGTEQGKHGLTIVLEKKLL